MQTDRRDKEKIKGCRNEGERKQRRLEENKRRE